MANDHLDAFDVCETCCACLDWQDPFTAEELGAWWTVVAGQPRMNPSGTGWVCFDDDAVLITPRRLSGAVISMRWRGQPAAMRIYFDWQDADNCQWVEWADDGGPTVAIYARTGGVTATLAGPVAGPLLFGGTTAWVQFWPLASGNAFVQAGYQSGFSRPPLLSAVTALRGAYCGFGLDHSPSYYYGGDVCVDYFRITDCQFVHLTACAVCHRAPATDLIVAAGTLLEGDVESLSNLDDPEVLVESADGQLAVVLEFAVAEGKFQPGYLQIIWLIEDVTLIGGFPGPPWYQGTARIELWNWVASAWDAPPRSISWSYLWDPDGRLRLFTYAWASAEHAGGSDTVRARLRMTRQSAEPEPEEFQIALRLAFVCSDENPLPEEYTVELDDDWPPAGWSGPEPGAYVLAEFAYEQWRYAAGDYEFVLQFVEIDARAVARLTVYYRPAPPRPYQMIVLEAPVENPWECGTLDGFYVASQTIPIYHALVSAGGGP